MHVLLPRLNYRLTENVSTHSKKNDNTMKTTLTALLTLLTAAMTFGQITTTKVAPKTDQSENTPYDLSLIHI